MEGVREAVPIGWKLVRDRQRTWSERHGVSGTYREVNGDEHRAALEKKLLEEIGEYFEERDVAELYDVLDVIGTLVILLDPYYKHGTVADAKREELGGFDDGLMWTPVPERYLGTATARAAQ